MRSYQSKPLRSNKKIVAPNGKKVKYRKTIYSARIFDLFDLGVMAQVRQRITAFESGCKKLRSDDCIDSTENLSKTEVKQKGKKKAEGKPNNASSCPSTPTSCGILDQTFIFRGETLAKRTDPDGQVRVLLQWSPKGM